MPQHEDDVLMEELAAAMAARSTVTEQARAAAQAAFSWRTVDEELLALSHDSAHAGELLVRGVGTARVLGFRGREVSLEVEVDHGQLTGQVIPAQSCRVAAVTPSGERWEVLSDESGVFMRPLDVSGPVRFVVESGGHTQGTAWVTL